MSQKKSPTPKRRKSLLQLLFPLCVILFVVWLIILGEFVVIAGWIVEIPPPVNGFLIEVFVATAKVGISALLGLGWLYLWNRVVRIYFRYALKNNQTE